MENKNTSAPQKQKDIHIERTFNLPIQTMWKAWSEPESFKKWWGPEGYSCPDCNIDFRVGGKLHAAMQGEDGQKIWSIGTFREIVPLKKIVVTDSFSDEQGNVVNGEDVGMPGDWPEEMQVTYHFEDVGGKTKLTIHHEGIPKEMYEDCTNGWQSSLDKLEKNFA